MPATVLRTRSLRSLLGLLLAAGLALPAWAVNRVALVIGNDNYEAVEKLRNAKNDAELMARTLREAGFDVTHVQDLDRRRFFATLDVLQKRINKGDEVVFFFAGHGVQIGSNPVLLPVDIQAASDRELEREGIPLHEVQESMRDARVSLLVIDACRDNPFPKTGVRSTGIGRGLVPPEAARGQAIIMSAGRGQKALDVVPGQTSRNGLFTHEFTQIIRQPGIDVRTALAQVRDRVEEKAALAKHDQRPSLVDELKGNFYIFAGGAAPVGSAIAARPAPAPDAPPQVAAVQLDDLQREDATRRMWAQWQIQMKTEFDQTAAFDGSADLQVRAWDRFLTAWARDNPNSGDDEALREQAQQRRARAVAGNRPPETRAPADARPAPVQLAKSDVAPPRVVETKAAEPAPAAPPAAPKELDMRSGDTHYQGRFVREDGQVVTGTGRVAWSNGDVYEGPLVRNVRQGKGEIVWAGGQRYKGDWVQDKATGKGELRFANGNVYEGDVVDGQPQGEGQLTYASGDVYKGHLQQGVPQGRGVYQWKNGQRYDGEWERDKPHGQGELRFANGNVFVGALVAGIPHGKGRMVFPSGDVYEGEFEAGLSHGKGTYAWKSGESYVGAWRAGRKNGQGVFTWLNGDRWEGRFADDERTDDGQMIRK